MEKHVRSLMKTLSWRIAATSTTIVLVFLFTENLLVSAGVGSAEAIVKTIVYYLHERIWNMSNFGREILTANLPVETTSRKNSPSTSDEDDQ